MARGLAAFALALQLQAPQAWDAERMTRAAQLISPRAAAEAADLQQMLQSQLGQAEQAQLWVVNLFFNRRIAFASDDDVWGVPDYWASPLESLAKGAGDCEDYAIAKYFSLVALGIPVAKLRLVYVRLHSLATGAQPSAHMVLAYYPSASAEPLVLDNLIGDIWPASRRPDLSPVFSFNSEGLWQGTGATSAGDPTARLSRWRTVLDKARAEGFL
jgi:predicted transglutaminase-like cysteine proteinase